MSRLVPLELALKAASAAIAIVGAQCTIFALNRKSGFQLMFLKSRVAFFYVNSNCAVAV